MNGSTCAQPPTASNRSAALPSSSTGIICDARIRRSAGARRTRLTSANLWLRRHWPPDAVLSSAVNLWTVGCADPRLTAQARSLWTRWGKRNAFPPPCPQVGGCPQASQHSPPRQEQLIFGECPNRQPATG